MEPFQPIAETATNNFSLRELFLTHAQTRNQHDIRHTIFMLLAKSVLAQLVGTEQVGRVVPESTASTSDAFSTGYYFRVIMYE